MLITADCGSSIYIKYNRGLSEAKKHDRSEDREIVGWERDRTRDVSVYVKPDEKTTIQEPRNGCNTTKPTFLLIIVQSATAHFDRRCVFSTQTFSCFSHT